MGSIVLELQRELLEGNCDVISALRKAHLIASKLHLSEFDLWIQAELNGYVEYEFIPEYRIVNGVLKAQNPFRGWIPTVIQDGRLEKVLCERKLGDSIGDIIELGKQQAGQFIINIPGDVAKDLDAMCTSPISTNYALFVSNHKLRSIIEKVRNCLLEWTIRLESEGILGEGMQFDALEKNRAESVPQTINNYFGNTNVINAPLERSAVIAGEEGNAVFSFEIAKNKADEIEAAIIKEDIPIEDREQAIELLAEIRDKIEKGRKPSVIKSLLVGLKDYLIGVGASATVAMIQSNIQILF